MARLQAGSTTFTIATQRTLEATKKILVRVAKREHSKVMVTEPQPATFRRFVDGKPGATEEAVKPTGVILYQYPRLDAVAKYALQVLFKLSPVGPPERGHYRDRHTVYVDGQAVASLKGFKGSEIVILNPLPYARKIEVGSMKMRVPGSSMVYQQAVRKVRATYGNIASVQFTYRSVGADASLRFPALVISEL